MNQALLAIIGDLAVWVQDEALPLWADAGFDVHAGCFQEQLKFDRRPVPGLARRAMVQARQISVYAHAAKLGWFPGEAVALRAADTLIARFGRHRGAGGFCFALDQEGRAVGPTMDLYGHAFVLFGLAWAWRLDLNPAYRSTAEACLDYLDAHHADGLAGGYREQEPHPDGLRRQNPHMHLFEALLEWHEATGDPKFLDRATRLLTLLESRLCANPAGLVYEVYAPDWSAPGPALEPGHLLEWTWLLGRYHRLTGKRPNLADRFFEYAIRHGLDATTGRVPDETTAAGTILKSSSRAWPHAEAAKALVTQHERGRQGCLALLLPVLTRLRAVYIRPDLHGGWMDQVNEADEPLSKSMPASSFYHLFLAISEAARLVNARPT